jgi:hypothetical protein
MRNYLTSGGLLEEGRSFRDSQFVGQQKADSDFENMPPFRPKDAAEDEYFRRTMVSAGQDADGTNLYHTPERSIYMKNKLEYQAQLGAAEDAFNKKMNNPFFKATDFVTDLVRNTVGAPINFLTDGVGFQSDPSKSAVKGYKAKIQELSDLQELNLEYFQNGRTTRASAFADSLKGTLANTASGTVKVNSKGEFVQPYQNGDSVVIKDENGNPVKAIDKSKIHFVNGVPHRWNAVSQTLEPTMDAEEVYNMASRSAEAKITGRLKANYIADRPQIMAAVRTEQSRYNLEMKVAISGARKYITDLKANGWTGLLSALPETQAGVLARYLETIKANVGFRALQEMRDNSPTGGALGNVSELELKQLNAVKGSLDIRTTAEQLLETLDTVDTSTRQALLNLEMRIADQDQIYGYESPKSDETILNNGQPTIDPQNPPPPVDDQVLQELQEFDTMFKNMDIKN